MPDQVMLNEAIPQNVWWLLQVREMSVPDLHRRMSEISRHVAPRTSYGAPREGISMDVVRKIMSGTGQISWHSRCMLLAALDTKPAPNGGPVTWAWLSKIHEDGPYPAAVALREARMRDRMKARVISIPSLTPTSPLVA